VTEMEIPNCPDPATERPGQSSGWAAGSWQPRRGGCCSEPLSAAVADQRFRISERAPL